MTRVLSLTVGVFYLLGGAAAFFSPATFYSAVATFAPYNLHLLHDVGAFQLGLAVALVAAAVAGRGLVPVLLGALAGSLLHLAGHVIDLRLGGHPATDLAVLTALVGVLAVALVFELRATQRRGTS